MPERVQVAVVLGLVLLGYLAACFVDARSAPAIAPAVALVVLAGTDWILRTAAPGRPAPLADRATFWLLPALLAAAFVPFLRHPLPEGMLAGLFGPAVGAWVGRLVVGGVGLALLAYALPAQRDSYLTRPEPIGPARFSLLTLVILAAFLLFGWIFGTREAAYLIVPGIGVVAGLLALELYHTSPAAAGKTWLRASGTGLVMAEVTWALTPLPLDGVRGGAVLILVYYVLSGLLLYGAAGTLTRRVAAEYAAIGVVGLIFVLISPAA